MSKLSLVINTASKDPALRQQRNEFRSEPYSTRYRLLKEQILPACISQGWDEIIVCGCFEEGAGYQYVPMQPQRRDRRDALHQRDLGGAYATGDVLTFCHDDHMPGPGYVHELRRLTGDLGWSLLVPKRLHGLTGQELNNGKEAGYMGGHCLSMRRWLWAEVPWTSVDSEWWDLPLSRLWREAGGKIIWTDSLTHIDLEATACES